MALCQRHKSNQKGRHLPTLGLKGITMRSYNIIKLTDMPSIKEEAAHWFHQKWGVPLEAYWESMDEALNSSTPVPQWYVVKEGEQIVGGLGIIENDFHDRKDLTPNVCAVYVEKSHRGQGIAGNLLQFACDDMAAQGIDTLYLITEHSTLYEKYGWEFYCMVQGEGEPGLSRMYIYRAK
jgi:GNAT superfamily N-acetyltransferase